jgi:DNA-cytosine methyltransferase
LSKVVLSLFDGISCGRLALEEVGYPIEAYIAAEVDKYASEITKKNFPDTIQVGDVRNIKAIDLPRVDLLIGGSPCTNLSLVGEIAGNRDGLIVDSLEHYLELKAANHDFGKSQSYLFWEYVRLLHETKPTYFMLENVKMSKKYEDLITKTLGVEPIMINSSKLAPQLRKRFYWTNIPNVTQPEDTKSKLQDVLESGYTEKDKAYCLTASYAKSSVQNYFIKKERQYKFLNPVKVKDHTYYLHDGNVITLKPQDGVKGNREKLDAIKPYVSKLSPVECERIQGVPDNYTQGFANVHRYKMLGNGWTVPVISHIFKNL